MKTDDVFGRNRRIGQLADWKGGRVCGDDRFWTGLHRQLEKDLFFDLDLFRGGLDDKLHIAQFHWCGGGHDPGATLLRFFLAHQAPLHSVSVSSLDIGQTAVDLLPGYIAENHSDYMRAEPLRDTRTHYAGANHRSVHNLLRRNSRRSFLVFLSQKEIADQLLSRFCYPEIDNRVQLKSERLLSGSKKSLLDHLEGARRRRIVIARHGNFLINLRCRRRF